MSALTVLHNTREQAPTHTHALKQKLSHFVANNNNNFNNNFNQQKTKNIINNDNNNKIREVLTRAREKTQAPRRGEPRSGFTMSSTARLLYKSFLYLMSPLALVIYMPSVCKIVS